MKKHILLSISCFALVSSLKTVAQTSIIQSADTICIGGVISFTVTGATGPCQSWYFSDDFSNANGTTASHQYNSTGDYYVSVTDYNTSSCTGYISSTDVDVVVQDTAAPSLGQLPDIICPNTSFYASTNSPGTKLRWDMGDGTIKTGNNFYYNYKTLGAKNVQLIAYKACGNDTVYKTVNVVDTITPIVSGTPSFPYDDTIACPNSGIPFSFYGIQDHTLRWYFGDGDSSTATNPIHSYSNAALYQPMLVVTNYCLNSDTVYTHSVKVTTGDTVTLHSWDYFVSPSSVCPNTNVSFDVTASLPDHTFRWDFGDGQSSNQRHATHMYTNPGTHTVTLTAFNLCGDSAKQTTTVDVNFSQTPNIFTWNWGVDQTNNNSFETCPGTPVDFLYDSQQYPDFGFKWFFGDGDSSSSANPVHSYTNTGNQIGKLQITNGCNNTVNYTFTVSINNTLRTVTGLGLSDTICLSDSAQMDYWVNSGPAIDKFLWKFGNGDTSNLERPVYQYSGTGSYTVVLSVTNYCGVTDSSFATIVVSGTRGKPDVRVDHDQQNNSVICVGEPFQFKPNHYNSTWNYYWEFGDGGTSNQAAPYHTYTQGGEYGSGLPPVKLVVTNGCGNFAEDVIESDVWYTVLSRPYHTDAGPDRAITLGGSTIIGVLADSVYPVKRFFQWSPATGLDQTNIPYPIAKPSTTTTYYLSVNDSNESYSYYKVCPVVDSVTVFVQSAMAGRVFRNNYNDTAKAGVVYLIDYDTTNQVRMDRVDTTAINSDGSYSFGMVNHGKYLILASPSTTLYPFIAPTYLGDTVAWDAATVYEHMGDSLGLNIDAKEYQTLTGPGKIEGKVVEGPNYKKMMGPGDPIKGINIGLIKKPSPGIVQMSFSDTTSGPSAGTFVFDNLPTGNYNLYVDVSGVPNDVSVPNTTFTITITDTLYQNVQVQIDSNLVFITSSTGINHQAPGNELIVNKVYPNPTSEYLDIELTNTFTKTAYVENLSFEFIDLQGRTTKSYTINKLGHGDTNLRLKVNDIPSGIYQLKVSYGVNSPDVTSFVGKIVILK